MTDNDKILINAYLDNELEANDEEYLEELFRNNAEARGYLENLKKANLEIDIFFRKKDFQHLDKQVTSFIAKRTNSYHFNDLIHKIFNSQSIGGFVTAALISFIYVTTPFSNDETNKILSFEDKMLSYDIKKYRNQQQANFEDVLKDSVNKMILDETKTALVVFGTNTFFIEMYNFNKVNSNLECYELSYTEDQKETFFNFCKSNNDSKIIFIN